MRNSFVERLSYPFHLRTDHGPSSVISDFSDDDAVAAVENSRVVSGPKGCFEDLSSPVRSDLSCSTISSNTSRRVSSKI